MMLPRVESGAKSEGGVGSLLEHSDVIAENVVRFLGVRSLVSFGATSKSHRVAMEEEVERRKRRIAATEVEVARLMAAQQQTATLSAYINKKLGVFYSSSHLEPEDQTSRYEVGDCGLGEDDFNEVKDLHSRVKKENVGGEVPFSHLSREDFIAAKKLVYDAMRLIHDEIGIFNTDLKTMWYTTYYFDVLENEEEEEEEEEDDEDWVFTFGNEEPGDKIHLFHEERQKFFSTVKNRRRNSAPGSLFILPKFFYFPPHDGDMRSMPIECIREAIWDAKITGNAVALRGEGEPEDFREDLLNCAMAIESRGTIEAFRIVAREMFLRTNKTMKPHLLNIIKIVDHYTRPGVDSPPHYFIS